MTLRTRLTLWYTAVLAAVLLLFGSIIYFVLTFSLTNQIEATLNQTADEVLETLAGGMPEDLAITLRALDLASPVSVQIINSGAEIIWQSNNAPRLNEPFDASALSDRQNVFTTQKFDDEGYRVLTVPVIARPAEDVLGYLQLASSLNEVELVRQSLLYGLFAGGSLALISAGLIGYFAAGAALSPLDEVTSTALQITRADDLSRRIPVMGPPSGEVGSLILAFNETLERLEGLFQTQRRFMADVSHELRTPLTTIRGNIDLIKQMGEADEESLEAISSEVDRMTRMVKDLLLLAQAETGKLPLAQEEVELDTLMLEVFQQAKVLANNHIHLELGREDQANVIGDRDRIKQILLNLVANAIEHTPEGGNIQLDLACEGDQARLSVSDTGPGIPDEELPLIFERFYRRDPSRKRKASGGAGLGLSIAYWIAKMHGGDLRVESTVGVGSRFELILPLNESQCD
ncbi:MAG: ATP-binding protein [Anaerolineales bacterium]